MHQLLNSFLFIQSSRLSHWQGLLPKDRVPRFIDQQNLIFANKPLNQQLNSINIVNSPLGQLLSKIETESLAKNDPTFLIGREAAILNFDLNSKQVLIARDFPGTETLYYYLSAEDLIISDSFVDFRELQLTKDLCQLKALEYIATEFALNNLTLWSQIHKVLPGEIIAFENYKIIANKRLTPLDVLNLPETTKNFNAILSNRITNYLPLVNCELSGGLDSSTIADSIWKLAGSEALKTYSVLYPDFICNEASEIQNFLDLRPHHNRKINFEILGLAQLKAVSKQIAYFPDYPNSLSSLPYLQIIKEKNRRVLVDGFGGDQLFNIWKTQPSFNSIDELKSLLLNNLKLRRIFRKRVFPWIQIDIECKFLTHLNTFRENYPKFMRADQLAMLQQLFSPNFSEYLESACLIAKANNLFRSHPFLSKEAISFALCLNVKDRTNKNYLSNNLRNSLGPSWKGPKKADFSETFQAYGADSEYQKLREQALLSFKDLISLESFRKLVHLTNHSSKELLVNWNLIGLKIMVESN